MSSVFVLTSEYQIDRIRDILGVYETPEQVKTGLEQMDMRGIRIHGDHIRVREYSPNSSQPQKRHIAYPNDTDFIEKLYRQLSSP